MILMMVVASSEEECGVVTSGAIGEEKSQVDYYQAAHHYDKVWGSDNLHFGYFPHLERATKTTVRLTHRQAATELTERMMRMAGVGATSKVLDLGAGKGRACVEIATLTGASCFGLDLTPANIERANELKAENPKLRLRYTVGSFTSLPADVLEDAPYDVIVSQVAFCHVHTQLGVIFREAVKVMGPQSLLMVNDYLGKNGDDFLPSTYEFVFKRLHFETLLGPQEWLGHAFDAGLKVQHYLTLDDHIKTAYLDMAAEARSLGLKTTDGTDLATAYNMTATAVDQGEIGMNLALLTL